MPFVSSFPVTHISTPVDSDDAPYRTMIESKLGITPEYVGLDITVVWSW
jgi:hypothetical protein